MKLYIKQKVFSWGDKFTVKDVNGEDRYFVEGEIFSWGKKLHVYDMCGNEVAFIQQKLFSFLPRYFVYVGDAQVAEIVKEFTFFFRNIALRVWAGKLAVSSWPTITRSPRMAVPL